MNKETKKLQGSKLNEWKINKDGKVCANCGIDKNLTVDHIIPQVIVSMLDPSQMLIYEDEENFQYLCSLCNVFKSNRLEKKHPKTKDLLIKYASL